MNKKSNIKWFWTDHTPPGYPRSQETADQYHERQFRAGNYQFRAYNYRQWKRPSTRFERVKNIVLWWFT